MVVKERLFRLLHKSFINCVLTWLSLKDHFGGLKIERGRVIKNNREPGTIGFRIKLKEPNSGKKDESVKIIFCRFYPLIH